MVEDILRCGLGALHVESGAPASFGAFLSAGATAQQAEAIGPRDLAHGEMGLASATKALACRIDPRESVQVESLHEVLLHNSGALSPGLHTTRRRLSTPLR